MFILRRFLGKESVESNQILGDSYNVVYRQTMPEEFKNHYELVFGSPLTVENDTDSVVAFITYADGSRIQPLYQGQSSYVMTETGATFTRLIVR